MGLAGWMGSRAMVLEGMREASRRKNKWGFLQTGHLRKPRESKKEKSMGGGVVRDMSNSVEGNIVMGGDRLKANGALAVEKTMMTA